MSVGTDEAFFPEATGGAGDVYSDMATYNYKDLTDNTNVNLDDDGKVTQGWNAAGYLAVANAQSVTQSYVWETLRHEVQHDSDQNRDKEAAASSTSTDENRVLIEGYKTEYRAYNYEGGKYDKLSHATPVTKYGYDWTEKQLAIFEGIFDGYEHTKRVWDDSTWKHAKGRWKGNAEPAVPSSKDAYNNPNIDAQWKSDIRTLQAEIVAYVNPDEQGFNKWNSVRVDDLYKALAPVTAGFATDPAAFGTPPAGDEVQVQKVIAAIARLSKQDAVYLRTESPDWTLLLAAKLTGPALAAINRLIANRAN